MYEPTLFIDKTLKNIEYIFRYLGINIKVEKKTPKDMYRSRTIYIFNLMWMGADVLGAFIWFVTGIMQQKNFIELTYIIPCITLSSLSTMRILSLILNEKKVDLLIEQLRKLEIEQINCKGSPETEEIMKEEDDYLNKVLKVLKIFYVMSLIEFGLSPMLLMLIAHLGNNEVELLLPFQTVLPFDVYDMRYYPWMYIRQIWSEIVVVYGIGAVDYMFYIFCTYLRMQFRLLRHYVEGFITSDNHDEFLRDKEEIKSKLVEIVEWHQELISSTDLLEAITTRTTLLNFMFSSVIICLTGFNVTVISDIAFIITFLCFLIMSLLQVFFLCFFGGSLMESSTDIGDGIRVYNSKWYTVDPSFGKNLLIMLTRTQSPCKLTASNFADVNLMAFMRVLYSISYAWFEARSSSYRMICSKAWSYFDLLQTLFSGAPQ